MDDRMAVERGDHVADHQAGQRGRPLRFHRENHHTTFTADPGAGAHGRREVDRLHRGAKPPARDVALGDDLVERTLDRWRPESWWPAAGSAHPN
jgi:hypothetical protein